MITICQPDGIPNPKKRTADPALIPPPMLYKAWLVLINILLYTFSSLLTVVLDDTLFKKLTSPYKYKQDHSMIRFKGVYQHDHDKTVQHVAASIHLPTGILLKRWVDKATPVKAPKGESNKKVQGFHP
jgi:hypothetical protein